MMDRDTCRQGMAIESMSPEDTLRLGVEFGRMLRPGDAVGLVGPLGAGKTQWVKGVVAGLGMEAPVTSPTFTLIHQYKGDRGEVAHVDAYRLKPVDDPQELGLEEMLDHGVIVMVEWADRLPGWFSGFPHFWVSFTMGEVNRRTIDISYVPSTRGTR